jgi:hypothetical protein
MLNSRYAVQAGKHVSTGTAHCFLMLKSLFTGILHIRLKIKPLLHLINLLNATGAWYYFFIFEAINQQTEP